MGWWSLFKVSVELFYLILALLHVCTTASPLPNTPTTPTTFAPSTIAPTSAPTTQAQPNRATSRRVATLQDCAKQGRNINCAFNPQVVVFDGYPRICEPTQTFLAINSTSNCPSFSNTTCRFDSINKCVSRNEQACIETPLWRLMSRGRDMVRLSGALTTSTAVGAEFSVMDVLRRTHQCTDLTNNITCEASSVCEWRRSPDTPSRVVTEGISAPINTTPRNFTESETQVPESQIVELIASNLPVRPDLKQIRVLVNRQQHDRTITITTQVRWVPRTEVQPRIRTGNFTLAYAEGATPVTVSDAIPFNANSAQLQTLLRRIPRLSDAQVSANVDRVDDWGRMSWVVVANNANNLRINSFSFGDTSGALNDTSARVSITRHQRNRQVIMMFGPSEPETGTFVLGYTGIDYTDEWGGFQRRQREFVPGFGTLLTMREIDARESAETFQAKLNNFEFRGIKVLDFVSVSIPDATAMRALNDRASRLGIGNNLREAWIVEFTTLVSEYERAEFPLIVVSTPVQLSDGTIVPFYGVSGSGGAIMQISAQVDVASPVVHGRFGRPQFFTAADPLPGLFALDRSDPMVIKSTRNISLTDGECLRLGGRYYFAQRTTFQSSASLYPSTIRLKQPIVVSNHVNDTSYRSSAGWQAFSCRPILNPPDTAALPSANVRAESDELSGVLSKAGEGYFADVTATVVQRNPYGELVMNVSITDGDGMVPRMSFVRTAPTDVLLPSCSLWNPTTCAQVSVDDVISGVARPSGTFRLIFAGYGARDLPAGSNSELDYARFFDVTSPLVSPSLRLEDGAGRIDASHPDGTSTSIFYSAPLNVDWFTKPDLILDTLQSLTPNIVELESTAFKVEELSPSRVRITFLLNSVEFAQIWSLPANVPQLAPISSVKRNPINRGLLGSDVHVRISTEVQGVGTLYNQIVTFEKADFVNRSPCRAEPVRRRRDLSSGFGDVAVLDELDQKALDCYTFGTSRTTCVGPEALVQDCIWRGQDATTLVDPPVGVDTRFLQRFWQTDEFFRLGTNSLTVNSNCTVSPVAALGIVVRMLRPLSNRLNSLNASVMTPALSASVTDFQSLYSGVQSDVEKFDRCGRNPVVEVRATQGGFVDVWQWLVTTTSYTCMFAYGLAGALLAYRMDKFRLLGFKWWDAFNGLMIIFGAACMGGIYGFVIGAVPAALISQMYASIPVNLSIDWAISLGVAQGVLIIYFDMGRGGAGAEAEIAFKHGH